MMNLSLFKIKSPKKKIKVSTPKIKFLGLLTRCKDEKHIKEFCDYYISQGVDKLYILDDDSDDKSIYNDIKNNDKIEIIYEKKIISKQTASVIYMKIRKDFIWMIYVDVDEFITTKKNIKKTIRDELKTTFNNVDCVRVPWVMMTFNGLKKNPKSLLETNIYRWDHDKKHPHKHWKFGCVYVRTWVKCIFKCDTFKYGLNDHYPYLPPWDKGGVFMNDPMNNIKIVGSIHKKIQPSDRQCYWNLREENIENGYLLCYHYRLKSIEHCKNKINKNIYYLFDRALGFTLEDLLDTDYPEIKDETLKNKVN